MRRGVHLPLYSASPPTSQLRPHFVDIVRNIAAYSAHSDLPLLIDPCGLPVLHNIIGLMSCLALAAKRRGIVRKMAKKTKRQSNGLPTVLRAPDLSNPFWRQTIPLPEFAPVLVKPVMF
jgi:hypothetical protein